LQAYLTASRYNNTFIHRSVPGFVLQGGANNVVTTAQGPSLPAVTTFPAVVNEYSAGRSNLRGTIAMAKLGSSPNSATSQWFWSLADNSANLDNQNGGFTVFGRVVSDTNVFNRLNTFQPIRRATNVVYPAGGAFNELPLLNYFEPLSLAQLYAGLLYVDITELPAMPAPVPDPGLPGVRLTGAFPLAHTIEGASALQGPWLTLSNFTSRASAVPVPDPQGQGPLRLYRMKVPFSLPRPE
jgi:cyclophilin family peptidyl-prolyl cis-trans isomerase